MPGTKDCVLEEAYKLFQDSSPSTTVDFLKFAELRSSNCLLKTPRGILSQMGTFKTTRIVLLKWCIVQRPLIVTFQVSILVLELMESGKY